MVIDEIKAENGALADRLASLLGELAAIKGLQAQVKNALG